MNARINLSAHNVTSSEIQFAYCAVRIQASGRSIVTFSNFVSAVFSYSCNQTGQIIFFLWLSVPSIKEAIVNCHL